MQLLWALVPYLSELRASFLEEAAAPAEERASAETVIEDEENCLWNLQEWRLVVLVAAVGLAQLKKSCCFHHFHHLLALGWAWLLMDFGSVEWCGAHM